MCVRELMSRSVNTKHFVWFFFSRFSRVFSLSLSFAIWNPTQKDKPTTCTYKSLFKKINIEPWIKRMTFANRRRMSEKVKSNNNNKNDEFSLLLLFCVCVHLFSYSVDVFARINSQWHGMFVIKRWNSAECDASSMGRNMKRDATAAVVVVQKKNRSNIWIAFSVHA